MQRIWNEGEVRVWALFAYIFLCVASYFVFLNPIFFFIYLFFGHGGRERERANFVVNRHFRLFYFIFFLVPSLCRDFALEIVLSDAGLPHSQSDIK